MSTLSVLIPCFNERTTIREIVKRVLAVELGSIDLEVVIIDDGSTDGSAAAIARLAESEPRIRVVTHPKNRGKGAALRTQSVEREARDQKAHQRRQRSEQGLRPNPDAQRARL